MKIGVIIIFILSVGNILGQKSEFTLSEDVRKTLAIGLAFNQKADLTSSGINFLYQVKPKHALELYSGLVLFHDITPKNSEFGFNYFYFPNENTKRLNLLFQVGTHYSTYSEKTTTGLGFILESRYNYFGLNSGFGFQWNLSQHFFTKMYFSGGYNFTSEATWYQNFDVSLAYRFTKKRFN